MAAPAALARAPGLKRYRLPAPTARRPRRILGDDATNTLDNHTGRHHETATNAWSNTSSVPELATGPGADTAALLDCHCHCWRRWPYAQVPDSDSRATDEQLVHEMDAHGIAVAAIVSASIDANADNLDYVAQACGRRPDRLRILAELDCSWAHTYHTPGSADRLRRLAERYPLAGFAHYLADRNDGWLRSDDADALFALAAERRLIVSLGASPAWQADLRALARRHPSVPVLCHALGLVRESAGPDSDGMSEVLAGAEVPNIYLKLCGLHYCAERSWDYPWPGVLALVSRLADAYGPRRLCWGSDFPASTRFCTFTQSLEVVRTHCATFLGADDLRLVLGATFAGLLASGQAGD
jgi:predicted TIM-barrel fold metal-dependent hydrolase